MNRFAISSAIAISCLICLPVIVFWENITPTMVKAGVHQEDARSLTTTLNRLHTIVPAEHKRLAKAPLLSDPETPIAILTILETSGLDSALICLRAVPEEQVMERDRIARLFACDSAERLIPLWSRQFPDDTRPQIAIEVARRYAEGMATIDELDNARLDAEIAAASVRKADTRGELSVAQASVEGVALTAAWAASGNAVWAAWDASREAAREAALNANRTAPWADSWDDFRAAGYKAAFDALDAEREAQVELLRKYL